MIRRNARLRRDYLHRRAAFLQEAETQARRSALKSSLAKGTALTPSLARDKSLQKDLPFDESQPDSLTVQELALLDDEWAQQSGIADPRPLITTSRSPSSRLSAFAKELRLLYPTSIRLNRGTTVLPQLVGSAKAAGLTDIVLVHEHRGVPSALTVSHLPHGPTMSFSLHGVQLRHDLPGAARGTVSESYPHLIFEGFSTALGKRVVRLLQHCFPPREEVGPDSKTQKVGNRVVTFVNREDCVEVRHHVFVRTSHSQVELAEVGPRMTMRLFEVRAGTLENKEGDVEWALNQYTRTGKKKDYL